MNAAESGVGAVALQVEVAQNLPMPLAGSFVCGSHELLALVGPSGAGKTSMIRVLAGLMRPGRGRVVVAGEVWCDTTAGVYLPPQRRHVGLVFQDYALMPHLDASRNVELSLSHLPRGERRLQAQRWLDHVGLTTEQQSRRPAQLSGGQQQRVAIARALAMEPKVMLFDEVTSALDPQLTGEVLRVIEDLARGGMTMVLVTHEMAFARNVAHQVVLMHQGRIWEEGPPAQMFGDPQTPELRQFLGGGVK